MEKVRLFLCIGLVIAAPFLVQCTSASDDGDDGGTSPGQAPGNNENTSYQSSCSYDSDCAENDADTMCGSNCGKSQSCREPGDLGTPCDSDFDCRKKSDPLNGMSERRCILGVCEDITGRGVIYGTDDCSLNSDIALETDDGELSYPFTGCVIADRGTYIELLLTTDGTFGNFQQPGEGWLSLSFAYRNLLGSDLRLFFAEAPELQDGRIGDGAVDIGAYWSVPDDFGARGLPESSVIAYYTGYDGTVCLGDSGGVKVTNFAEEHFRSVCAEDQQGDDGQGRLSLDFEIQDLSCTSQSLTKQSSADRQAKRFSGTVTLNSSKGSRGERMVRAVSPPPGGPEKDPKKDLGVGPAKEPTDNGGECTAGGVFDCGNEILCKVLPDDNGKFRVATMVSACNGCSVRNSFLTGERSKETVCYFCTYEDIQPDDFDYAAFRRDVCNQDDSFYKCSYNCACHGEGCN